MTGIRNGARLLDLVRYQRQELHEAGLITDEEYAELARVGSESARRLEDYDDLRASLKVKDEQLAELERRFQAQCRALGEAIEARRMADAETDRLRRLLAKAQETIAEKRDVVATLAVERDEARAEVVELSHEFALRVEIGDRRFSDSLVDAVRKYDRDQIERLRAVLDEIEGCLDSISLDASMETLAAMIRDVLREARQKGEGDNRGKARCGGENRGWLLPVAIDKRKEG